MNVGSTSNILMDTGSTSSSSSVDQSVAAATSATSQLGENQFLQLLIAQLQNQDPLNPVDNQDFISQLATFSSLEQLTSINSGVNQLVTIDQGSSGSAGTTDSSTGTKSNNNITA
jgi:flagellar basal-body rod modification protein FlgD